MAHYTSDLDLCKKFHLNDRFNFIIIPNPDTIVLTIRREKYLVR